LPKDLRRMPGQESWEAQQGVWIALAQT
jgi:hypothetical protein